MSKAKKIYLWIVCIIIFVLFIIWFNYPKRETEAKYELSMNYELYNNFVDIVKETFKNIDYDYIYIRKDGRINAIITDYESVSIHNNYYACDVYFQIAEYGKLNEAYHNIYPERLYDVVICLDSERRVAMIIPYSLRYISSEQYIIDEMIYKEEGFVTKSKPVGFGKSCEETIIEKAHAITGEQEWYYWSEKGYVG